jgi:hypothetical protein
MKDIDLKGEPTKAKIYALTGNLWDPVLRDLGHGVTPHCERCFLSMGVENCVTGPDKRSILGVDHTGANKLH